jgi:hypothetical protein
MLGCDKKSEPEILEPAKTHRDMYDDKLMMQSLERKLISGDTLAYNEYQLICSLSGHDKETLFYSLIVAEEFNYHRAYFNAYYTMTINTAELKSKHYNDLKMYYLLKAYELGNRDALDEINRLYPNANILKSETLAGGK